LPFTAIQYKSFLVSLSLLLRNVVYIPVVKGKCVLMTSSRCIRFLCAYVRACECARLLVPTCVPVSTFDTSRPTFMDLDKLRFCVHHCTTDAFLKPLKLWRRANFLTHCGRVTQICVFNTVKLGKSASSP